MPSTPTPEIVYRTITFNSNEGSDKMTEETVADGSDYLIPAVLFSKTGCTFVSWNTSADGKGTEYADKAEIANVKKDITLYAIWNLDNVIKYIDFDNGLALQDIFDTVNDPNGTVTIQNDIAVEGYAIRNNCAAEHLLEVPFESVKDLWVLFDLYVESKDTFKANTFTPLLLLCDAFHTDSGENPKLVGTPLFNYPGGENAPEAPYDSLKPLTNIRTNDGSVDGGTSIQDRVIIETPVANLFKRWIQVKIHIKMDDTLSGVDLYLDGSPVFNSIKEGDPPEDISFNRLRIWYHDHEKIADKTNIYFDNIGLYREDPDTI